jgi:hypothetical protein
MTECHHRSALADVAGRDPAVDGIGRRRLSQLDGRVDLQHRFRHSLGVVLVDHGLALDYVDDDGSETKHNSQR